MIVQEQESSAISGGPEVFKSEVEKVPQSLATAFASASRLLVSGSLLRGLMRVSRAPSTALGFWHQAVARPVTYASLLVQGASSNMMVDNFASLEELGHCCLVSLAAVPYALTQHGSKRYASPCSRVSQ